VRCDPRWSENGSGGAASEGAPIANCGNSSNAKPGPKGARATSGDVEIVGSRR
jgi:hypothetical protein